MSTSSTRPHSSIRRSTVSQSRPSRDSNLSAGGDCASFTSATDLIVAIENFIDGWNDRCHPFTWTKTADEILSPCAR